MANQKREFRKLFDIKTYKNALIWEMAGYNYFHSLFDGSSLKSFGKYFVPFTDLIMEYKDDRLLAFSPRDNFVVPGFMVIEELISQKADYYYILKEVYENSIRINEELFDLVINRKMSNFEKNWNKYYIEHAKEIQILFYFDFAIDEWLKNIHIKNPKLHGEIIAASNPINKSFIQEEVEELYRIKERFSIKEEDKIEDLLLDKRLVEKIKKHKTKWGWVQNSYAGVKDISIEELLESMKKAKLAEMSEKDNSLPRKYKLLAKTIGLLINMKDERKKQMLLLVSLMDININKISKEINVPVEKLIWFSHKEVERIRKTRKYDKDYSQDRWRAIFVANDEEIDLSEELVSDVRKVAQHKIEEEIMIKGSVANRGKVNGFARIITGSRDAGNMKKGEILIASMTRPDFMIAIKRAAAIATDEGGVACHAAIISREFGIPCIVGTKIATKVIKDGDLIEVDAEKGIVKIIEKAKK
jgi:phosphohistidine swiveling domain-containing protein